MVSEKYTTQEIVTRCLQGDRLAYNELYAVTSKPIYNSLVRLLGNQEDAKDVLQETYLSVFKNINGFRAESNPTTWIKRIAINKALNEIKRAKINFSPIEVHHENLGVDRHEETDYHSFQGVDVARKMEELPEGYRIILSLFLFENLSHQEIADELGISVSTSKSQYHRGKIKLKELLVQPTK